MKLKNNKIIHVLLLITLVVWGLIFYTFLDYFHPPDEESFESSLDNLNVVQKPKTDKYFDTTFIHLTRDPFTFSSPKKEYTPVPQKPSPKPEIKQHEPRIISYQISGVIINEDTKLVIINEQEQNKTHFLREGEEFNNIKIKNISFDKVTLVENNSTKEVLFK